MNQLMCDLYVILETHNGLHNFFTEASRRIVGYLLEALEPAGFREIVRHQLTMESNKDKKKQIVPFCKWVFTMLEQYVEEMSTSVSRSLHRRQRRMISRKNARRINGLTASRRPHQPAQTIQPLRRQSETTIPTMPKM
ncbi:hypothetical protein PI124_g19941 [Phytophthora idaei]|nr:hypothetical protein PI126_g19390 [Phytophthora idaei]KAG3235016.1 hypothetical protein PI124_g19941 [Phytophthora idaei]